MANAIIHTMVPLLVLALLCPFGSAGPDYGALFAHGISFGEFLERAHSRRDEWRTRYRDAVVAPEVIEKARALHERRRLLVVAEDWCSDSAQTVPYLAKLVDAAPGTLDMRIVNSRIGRPVMDAHPTPDGRGATPTVAVTTADGALLGAWSERPAELETWAIEQRKGLSQRELHARLAKWYADDAGRSALEEITTILAR